MEEGAVVKYTLLSGYDRCQLDTGDFHTCEDDEGNAIDCTEKLCFLAKCN